MRSRGRGGVERIVFGLDHSSLPGVAEGGEALGHEAARASFAGGGQQGVGALGPQPVGLGEGLVQLPGEATTGQRRRLVDDALGPGFEDGPACSARVEQVERDRLGAERPDPLGVSRRPERPDHLVPPAGQLGHQPGADRTACSDNHDSHEPDSLFLRRRDGCFRSGRLVPSGANRAVTASPPHGVRVWLVTPLTHGDPRM